MWKLVKMAGSGFTDRALSQTNKVTSNRGKHPALALCVHMQVHMCI